MRHYGDITKLSGYDLPVVDIITGGSPCQDLSIAGKRAGLAGERSGLFMEQVRIVKEMRERDARDTGRTGWAVRPRYMVWENVPGAFSSNSGKDFQAVLEEIVRIVENEVPDLSTVVQGGWTKSGCLYEEMGKWSVAWRVHDAQFWGVPQRRKRIALVADFGGLSAPEILFEREGVSGNSEPSGEERQGTPAGAEDGAGSAISFQERAGKPGGGKGILIQRDHVGALSTLNNQSVYSIGSFNSEGMKSENSGAGIYETDTVRTLDMTGGNPACYQGGIAVVEPILLESNQNNATVQTDGVCTALPAAMGMGGGYVPMVANTLSARHDGSPQPDKGNGANIVAFAQNTRDEVRDLHDVAGCLAAETGMKQQTYVAGFKSGQGAKAGGIGYQKECAPTLSSVSSGTNQTPAVFESHSQDSRYNSLGDTCETVSAKYGTGGNNMPMVVETQTYQKVVGTIDCGIAKGTGNQLANQDMFVTNKSQVRRLTPMECERLQGYPDGWTDIGEWTDSKGKRHKDADSPRYKALGNSIALPFWAWLARRICAQYERPMTMASLFDGIGGFPLVFSRAGCVPVWASEIEEFPIAVTKKHFPEVETHES